MIIKISLLFILLTVIAGSRIATAHSSNALKDNIKESSLAFNIFGSDTLKETPIIFPDNHELYIEKSKFDPITIHGYQSAAELEKGCRRIKEELLTYDRYRMAYNDKSLDGTMDRQRMVYVITDHHALLEYPALGKLADVTTISVLDVETGQGVATTTRWSTTKNSHVGNGKKIESEA